MNHVPTTVDKEERTLSEHHLSMLRDSGISVEVIAQRGYYTEHNPEELARLGFDERQKILVPALVIPIRDVSGEVVLHRIRPDNPRPNLKNRQKLTSTNRPPGLRTSWTSRSSLSKGCGIRITRCFSQKESGKRTPWSLKEKWR